MEVQKSNFREITLKIPNDFKVMDGGEFLKLRELIKAGLEIIESIGDYNATDKTAQLLWPVLRFATDVLKEYPETIDILDEVARFDASKPKEWRAPVVKD